MPITTISELQDTVNTIHEKALFTAQHKAIMSGLVWNIRKPKGQSTVDIPYFSEVVANQLTEGMDMVQSETMVDTNAQVTLNEVGAKIILTDVAMEDNQEELKSVAGKILGDAYEKKRDQDLLALLDNAASSLAGSATTLTMGHIAAAKALLAGQATDPAPDPYVCVLHPFQTLDLVDILTPIAPSLVTSGTAQGIQSAPGGLAESVIRNYAIGQLFGMPVIEDGNASIDSGDDVKTGVFSRGEGGAIVLVTARDMSIMPERDESLRGWELNCVGRYGVGNYKTNYVVELYTDAATPA